DGDRLALGAVIAAHVGRVIGAGDGVTVGTGLVADDVGLVRDRHRSGTVIRGADQRVGGGRHLVGATNRAVRRETGNGRGRLVIDRNRLGVRGGVAAYIGRVIRARDGVAVDATARGDDIRIVGDRHGPTAVVGGRHRTVVGRRNLAGA